MDDETWHSCAWKKQRNELLEQILARPNMIIEVQRAQSHVSAPICRSSECRGAIPWTEHRVIVVIDEETAVENDCGGWGVFHIRCLEEMLYFSSPEVLPHITYNKTSSNFFMLDHGAVEILNTWYGQCKMDNEFSEGSNAVATADEQDARLVTKEWAPPASPVLGQGEGANSAPPAIPNSHQWRWQGKSLVPLSATTRDTKGQGGNDRSWHPDTDADSIFVPWAEDIITKKLPRLPRNGGFILEKDAVKKFRYTPLRTADSEPWGMWRYLPMDPSQWSEKHVLSESLDRWIKDKVGYFLASGSQ